MKDFLKKFFSNDKAAQNAEANQKKNKMLIMVVVVIIVGAALILTGGDEKPVEREVGSFNLVDTNDVAQTRWVGEAVDDVALAKRRIETLNRKGQETADEITLLKQMVSDMKKDADEAKKAYTDTTNVLEAERKARAQEALKQEVSNGTNTAPNNLGQPFQSFPPPTNTPNENKFGLSYLGEVPGLGIEEGVRYTPMQGTLSYTTVNKAEEPKEEEIARKNAKRHIIPTGSIIKAVLLSGMDAPTMTQAKTEPLPVLMKITDLAILPNRWEYDISECFLMGEGYGELTSERAYIRVNNLSCITDHGQRVDMSIKGSVSGEDGKLGLKGDVVTKQGALLARTLIAGFLQGLGEAYGDYGDTMINGTGGITTTNMAPDSKVFRGGLFQGMSQSAEKLADFYLKMADQVTPVIEISAGREVNVLITQMAELQTIEQTTTPPSR